MSAVLLDASFLIALLFPDHQHHEVARSWLIGLPESDSFATDAITEGALTRYSVRLGLPATDIHESLLSVHNHPRWCFWPDVLSYCDISLLGVRGHRQVTDTYLAALARHYGGRVLTFDRPFASRCRDAVILPPRAGNVQ